MLDNFVIAFLAVSVAFGAVVPSGDTRLAITLSAVKPTGVGSPVAGVFTLPCSSTSTAL